MKLYEARKSRSLTLRKLSDLTGINITTLWRIENVSDYKITLRDAITINKHFPEVSMEDLNHAKSKPMQPMRDSQKA